MNMDLINVNKEKCVGCGACMRACPMPEANVLCKAIDGETFVTIKQDKCIGCGACITACTQETRTPIDDLDALLADLKKGRKCALLVSSEFKFSFNGNWKGILDWFKKQGVTHVYDGAFGAEIHTWATAKYIRTNNTITALSSACAAVNNYMLRDSMHLDKVIPIFVPDACMVVYIKKYLSNTLDVAVISPCLAEKQDLMEAGAKYFITCDSVNNYLKAQNIVIKPEVAQTASYNFAGKQGWFGSLMAMPEGYACNLDYMQPEGQSVVVTDKGRHIFDTLESYFKMPDFKKQGILDLSPCGGCTHSACAARTITDFEARKFYRGLSLESADMREIKGGRFGNGRHKDELFEEFESSLKSTDFLRKLKAVKSDWVTPKNAEFDVLYKSMGLKADEHTLNCGACGYATCELMATAIHNKQNVKENCIMYCNRLSGKDTDTISSNGVDIDIDVLSTSTFKLYADVEEIKQGIDAIKTKCGLSRDMSLAIDRLLTSILVTCQSPTFDNSDLTDICEVLNKLKTVVASQTNAMVKTTTNADIVDEAIVNINDEMKTLSQLIATAAGISEEEMGARVEKARESSVKVIDTETTETEATDTVVNSETVSSSVDNTASVSTE